MNKETARSLFMDYLYDELESSQRKELERYLTRHSELKKELEELGEVRSMLQQLPAEDPSEQLVMVESAASEARNGWKELINRWIPQSRIAQASFAMASLLILFVIFGAFSRMNISINEHGFQLAFGELGEPAQQGYTAEQVEYLLDQVRHENAVLVAEAVEAVQQKQEEKLEQTLFNFADYIERQRQNDLQMISSGFNNMEETYYTHFRQTDHMLGELIQTVNRN